MFLLMLSSLNLYAEDKEARMHLELGKIEGQKKNYEKSIEHFKQCVFAFSGCAYNIGITYEKLNQLEDAFMWYDISARQGLPEAKQRLAFHNKPIPDNDLERENNERIRAAGGNKDAAILQFTIDALNALVSGYNRGAERRLNNRPRNASCTVNGNNVDCFEY